MPNPVAFADQVEAALRPHSACAYHAQSIPRLPLSALHMRGHGVALYASMVLRSIKGEPALHPISSPSKNSPYEDMLAFRAVSALFVFAAAANAVPSGTGRSLKTRQYWCWAPAYGDCKLPSSRAAPS